MKKKLIWIIILLIIVAAGGAVFYANRGDKDPVVTSLKMSRGDIVDGVGATGTLQAVTTVTVGTQVSGIVQDLYADFNSIVKKNQVLARLNPDLMQTALETSKANLTNAQANLEKQKVAVTDSETKLVRAKELMAKQLLTQQDMETADVTEKQAVAQLKSMESQVVQAQAAVDKAQVDLDHTIITAPIDGIVIKRSVDKGQTVNAGMSAPELFILAADLTKMQVNANIDESDVGRMRPAENVTFRVDAYPNDTFHGTVNQVRLNPTTVQNVVTYSTVIDVPNPDLRLKPGMTANVNIEIARRTNVLRVPNAALRFRPTTDMFDALHEAVPPEMQRGFGRGGRPGTQNAQNGGAPGAQPGATPAPAAPGAVSATPSASAKPGQSRSGMPAAGQPGVSASINGQANGQAGGRGGFANMTPEERQKRMQDRLAAMTPDQRAQYEQRMKDRQANGGGAADGGRGANPAKSGVANAEPKLNADGTLNGKGATIDSLFGPLPVVETRGRVWLYVNKQLKSVALRLGISDGTNTEVLNDTELQPDTEVVTSFTTPESAAKPAGTNNANGNPLMPQRGNRGGRPPGR